jgi:hypothetical protein
VRWQRVQEVLHRPLPQRYRDESFDVHLAELEWKAHLAAQDRDLSGDVDAGQVVARIRLRVAERARLVDERGERA